MSSKILQKPSILGIEGSTIKIAHPKMKYYPKTQATGTIAAGGTALTVNDNNGFSDDDWFIIGEIGDNRTEECDVNGAVTRGTSLTVTNTLKFSHELDSPVQRIQERGIKIYGAATDGGAGTLIVSIDAITAPIADATLIDWNNEHTEYTLKSTDTAYAYYYVIFTDGTTNSSASDYIPSTGWDDDRTIKIIEKALNLTDTVLNDNITLEMCIGWVNEAQERVTQFKYQEPNTGALTHVDWDFEVVEDTSLVCATNKLSYAVSGMTYPLKYSKSDRAIISIRIGDQKPLEKMTTDEYDNLMFDKPSTLVATQAEIGDTSLVVDSNVEFGTTGSLYLGSDLITYTGKTGTTTFTGIPASGTGSITAQNLVGVPVWQNVKPALPTKYVLFDGTLYFNNPVKSDYENFVIKIRCYKKLTALTEASSQTLISFYNSLHLYLSGKIEIRKGKIQEGQLFLQEFETQLLNNALANSVPVLNSQGYYSFTN